MKVDDIKQELANMENIEDLSPPNEIFYLCGGDSIPLTLCHKIRIGNEFFNYFCEDESRIKEFLSNKSLINKIFYTYKYIAQTPILHVVYNGAPYYIKVEEDNLSVFRKYNIVMHDEPLAELEKISSDFDNELISFDESERLTQATYEKFGCNIYHDKYLNYKNLMDCDAADKIIKDDNHVFGEMKLYIQDEKNSDFHLSIMNVKNALSELYEI